MKNHATAERFLAFAAIAVTTAKPSQIRTISMPNLPMNADQVGAFPRKSNPDVTASIAAACRIGHKIR